MRISGRRNLRRERGKRGKEEIRIRAQERRMKG